MSRWVGCLLLALVALESRAGDLERALESRLRGAWVVATVEVYSGCAGTYTNNRVSAAGVAAGRERRFEPGEVAKVDKLNLKRSGLDLYLSLAEHVLVPHQDGPFELYDERECRVQLMLELPREAVAGDDLGAALAAVERVVEVHPSLAEATASRAANGRRREDYPADYQLTLARHAVWQAEQANAAVSARSQQAQADALRALERVHRDPPYLDGFAAGVEAMRSWLDSDCASLVAATFSGREQSAPKDRGSDRSWGQGYRDGQELAFNLALLDRLRGCYLPVPSLAGY